MPGTEIGQHEISDLSGAEHDKAAVRAVIDAETFAAIPEGFDYEIDPGTGTSETLHFSYDVFDQQNFSNTANACLILKAGAHGLPESVTWNAYRAGGELVRLVLTADAFLALYAGGALMRKTVYVAEGGTKKAAPETEGTA